MLRELIEQDTPLRRVAGTHGGEYAGPCPWCGGRDRFRVWPEADQPGYWCRRCDRRGDAIQYLRDRDGLSYRQACERLRVPIRRAAHEPSAHHPSASADRPSLIWQARARALIDRAAACLWSPSGAKALAYLHRRGFQDAILQEARIGYSPCERREPPTAWGFPDTGKPIWIPRRTTIFDLIHNQCISG